MMTRKTYSPKVMAELELRFPNEHNDVLAKDMDIELESLRYLATKMGWKKSKEFKAQVSRENQNKVAPDTESILRIRAQMKGGDRRFIHTGELLIKGNLTVHLQRA